jgi:predicted membrane GTPase involved in stress response
MEERMRQNDKKIDELTEILKEHLTNSLSNRELEHYFGELKVTLDRIEQQTIKTNGRVSKLEIWKETMTAKIGIIVAGIGIAWLLFKELFPFTK